MATAPPINVTITDNSTIKAENLEGVKNLVDEIADKKLDQFATEALFILPEAIKDREDIEEDDFILRKEGESYKTSNIMGFIGRGKERITITSRFCAREDYFLQYMLMRVLRYPATLHLNADAQYDNTALQWLIFLFPHQLKISMRKGAYKTYMRNAYNDFNVKGTIDIARHIKLNTPFQGRVAYSQRELSYDNPLMQLIRHTIEYIKAKRHGSHLLTGVKDEVQLITLLTSSYALDNRRKIIELNKKNPIRHAYYHDFRMLQKLCIAILQFEKMQMGKGREQIYGILFDGSWLWEEYVHTLTRKRFHHPCNRSKRGMQYLLTQKQGKIYPDFISKSRDPRIIADAKYKPIENIGKKNKDYFQLLAYMFRFDSKKGYFIYPERNSNEQLELYLNNGTTYDDKKVEPRKDITVTKYGLAIPKDVEDFEDFKDKMKKSEEALIGEMELALDV